MAIKKPEETIVVRVKLPKSRRDATKAAAAAVGSNLQDFLAHLTGQAYLDRAVSELRK